MTDQEYVLSKCPAAEAVQPTTLFSGGAATATKVRGWDIYSDHKPGARLLGTGWNEGAAWAAAAAKLRAEEAGES